MYTVQYYRNIVKLQLFPYSVPGFILYVQYNIWQDARNRTRVSTNELFYMKYILHFSMANFVLEIWYTHYSIIPGRARIQICDCAIYSKERYMAHCAIL